MALPRGINENGSTDHTIDGSAHAANQFTGAGDFLPKEISSEVLQSAQEQSVVMRLAGSTPISLGETGFPVALSKPEVGVVGEGAEKPTSDFDYGVKFIKPVKMASILVVSKEFTQLDPARAWSTVQEDLSFAIARGIDLAVLHGRSSLGGGVINGVEYVDQTTNRVNLGETDAAQGGLTGDFVAGWSALAEAGYDMTAFAADPRLRGQLMTAVDLNGRPVYQNTPSLANSGFDTLLGLPVVYGKTVSGRNHAGQVTGTSAGVRAYAGDWQNSLKFGFAENITFSRSTEASVNIGGSTVNLWQQNLVGLLVEAQVGWVVMDTDAFVAYGEDIAPS